MALLCATIVSFFIGVALGHFFHPMIAIPLAMAIGTPIGMVSALYDNRRKS